MTLQQETKNWCGTNFQEKAINRRQKIGAAPIFKKKQSIGNKKVVAHQLSRKNNQQKAQLVNADSKAKSRNFSKKVIFVKNLVNGLCNPFSVYYLVTTR